MPKLNEFFQNILVILDFANIVEFETTAKQNQYFRPVQWVLTNTGNTDRILNIVQHFVIINLFKTKNVKTILYLYAPRLTFGFKNLKNFRFYPTPAFPTEWSVPRYLVFQLNLFANQFYIFSFVNYIAFYNILGLDWENNGKNGMVVCANGFVDPVSNPGKIFKYFFKNNPVNFFKIYLTKIRRDCESIEKTHIGKILNAIILQPEDF
ncbi:hypothetical protein PoMZ_09201 [Pyricularia oryzae]|uniref:Uncharacterized protein n=1 Tax=Pyricularia oryzae TaxID=318829 RepID=A0A4V1C4N6_PYROR|nr:hypothetical protein PoMZ_09201 [Pyricularia oryzae]